MTFRLNDERMKDRLWFHDMTNRPYPMHAADYIDRKLVAREKRSSIIGAIVLTIAALVIGSLITLGFCLR